MSHNYLLDLNQHIEARLATLTANSENTTASPEEYYRNEGRLDVLKKFQSMLCRQYYPKLPKRLYRRLTVTVCEPPPPDI